MARGVQAMGGLATEKGGRGGETPVAVGLALQQPVKQSLQEIRDVRPVGAQQGHQGGHACSHGLLNVCRGGPQNIHQGLQNPLDLQTSICGIRDTS